MRSPTDPDARRSTPNALPKGATGSSAELRKVIVGQDDVVEQVLIALFTGGHCLITGVPGLAKTLLIKTLADILDLDFKRIQFTPDLMPSDITGTEILDEEHGSRRLRFVKGPIFAQIILADEINRTPPKTQAALLEAMQEHHVTAAGRTYALERAVFRARRRRIRSSSRARIRCRKRSSTASCSTSSSPISLRTTKLRSSRGRPARDPNGPSAC